jgi:LacI family gluconate utilization system Gnt-I transcriptional repressor
MIGAGGLLWMREQGYDVPGTVGMAGFNDVQLLHGLPSKLATMDSCRQEIGRRAAEIILARLNGEDTPSGKVELTPVINPGDTLRTP